MTTLLLIAWTAMAGSGFEVHRVELPGPETRILLAAAREETRADVLVLTGNILTAYSARAMEKMTEFAFPPGTSAFDIDDIDDDRRTEIVMVCGDRIVAVAIADAGQGVAPRELFSLHTLLADASNTPFPYVLIVHDESKPLLALPCEETFELRGIDGSRVKSLPVGPDAPRRVSFGAPFEAWTSLTPQVGSAGALEGRVNRTVDFAPEWSDEVPLEVQLPRERRGTQNQIRDAANLDEASWPWFPLRTDGTSTERVLYALDPPDYRNTIVRMRTTKTGMATASEKDIQLGPKRRYPGRIVVIEDSAPDINGDGYVDLLLVSVPEPAASIDGLTRALAGQTWPCRITAHLFSTQKQRYEPVPDMRIEYRLPIPWLLTSELTDMARYWVARDLDGDGRSDLTLPVAADKIAVWLSAQSGFNREPDFVLALDSPLLGVEFQADLEGKGRTALGLRTERTLYVLTCTNGN